MVAQPPRMRIEEAALDVAARADDDFAAIAVLADVVQSRATSYAALQRALEGRARVPRGAWLRRVLPDLATGACSVLEHEYLLGVERAHGLPTGQRQLTERLAGRRTDRDVSYRDFGLLVELDGRTFHDTARQRDLDLDRDLDAAVHARMLTVRLGWGQVLRRPCQTAVRVGALLARGGWRGDLVRCPRCPREPVRLVMR